MTSRPGAPTSERISRPSPLLAATLVFCVSMLVSALLVWRADLRRTTDARAQALHLAQSRAQILQRNVERLVSNNYALAAMVRQGGGQIGNFDAAATELLSVTRRLLAVSISPGGVVRDVAPRQGNEGLIGFDQLRDPKQKAEAIFTRDTGRLTLAGPLNLAQGGVGLVSRLPVFLSDANGAPRFWGFTNVTIRLTDLLGRAALTDLPTRGYDYRLWRLQVDSRTVQVIASSTSEPLPQPVRQSLEVPNGAWNLDLAPSAGWADAPAREWGLGAGLLVSLLLAYLAALLVQQRRYKAGLESLVLARTAEIRSTQDQLRSTLSAIRDPIFELGLDGRYYGCSAPSDDLLPAPAAQVVGKTVFDLLPKAAAEVTMEALRAARSEGDSQGEQYSLALAHGTRWFELSVVRKPLGEGADMRFVVMTRDVTGRKTAKDEIRRLAYYDPLTELPNRRLLQDRLEHALSVATRARHQGALLLIDLDNFKELNDTWGHDKGDLLLKQVAARLRACVRECDTVARLGGDEFVVMIDDAGALADDAITSARIVARKIVERLGQPYDVDGREHRSSCSMGISLFGADTATVEEIVKRADVAMYQAKADGRDRLCFFDPAMQAAVEARAALEVDLRRGLTLGELMLHYQPQMGPGRRVIGAEALLRWTHPVRGAVSPAEFIPIAEQSGLIVDLGEWVLNQACAELARWATQAHTERLTLAVNVSVHQFRQPDFVDRVRAALRVHGARAQRLKLEITESMFVQDVENIIGKMDALKAHGVGFSLDDFGTGYSSLSYLKRLPLDQIKIDQSFVRDVLTDPNDAAIARTIVALGRSLGLDVIAEGVETEGQRQFLEQIQCELCQGYLFSHPLPTADFDAFVAANFSPPAA